MATECELCGPVKCCAAELVELLPKVLTSGYNTIPDTVAIQECGKGLVNYIIIIITINHYLSNVYLNRINISGDINRATLFHVSFQFFLIPAIVVVECKARRNTEQQYQRILAAGQMCKHTTR